MHYANAMFFISVKWQSFSLLYHAHGKKFLSSTKHQGHHIHVLNNSWSRHVSHWVRLVENNCNFHASSSCLWNKLGLFPWIVADEQACGWLAASFVIFWILHFLESNWCWTSGIVFTFVIQLYGLHLQRPATDEKKLSLIILLY